MTHLQQQAQETPEADTAGTPAVIREPPRRINEWIARRARPAPATAPARGWVGVVAATVVGLLVLTIVIVGLRTSLGALGDMARAAHIEQGAAGTYWIGVDGLIVVAIIAAMVLRHDRAARTYCLLIVCLFTLASGLLQYLHGLGLAAPDRATGQMKPLPEGVVFVIALLVIGTIFFGTHLFVHVLRRLFPGTAPEQASAQVTQVTQVTQARNLGDQARGEDEDGGGEPGPGRPSEGGQPTEAEQREERKRQAAIAINLLLDNGVTPKRTHITRAYQISDRQAARVLADVALERELRAELEAAQEQAAAEATAHQLALTGASPNGSTPHAEATP